MPYFPVDRDLFSSTVWVQTDSETKVVWMFLLGNADHRTGEVRHTLPALAAGCGVPIDSIRTILKFLSEPDEYSRTKDCGGRRIVFIDPENWNAGIRVINNKKYREKARSYSTLRRQAHDERYPEKAHRKGEHGGTQGTRGNTGNEAKAKAIKTTLSSGDDGSVSGPRIQDGVRIAKSVKRHLKNDEVALWNWWRRVHRKSDAHVIDNKRLGAMRRALDNHTLEEMKKCVIGCANSPYHRGENDRAQKYNDIALVCRDEKHFSDFVRLYKPGDEREYGEDFGGEEQ